MTTTDSVFFNSFVHGALVVRQRCLVSTAHCFHDHLSHVNEWIMRNDNVRILFQIQCDVCVLNVQSYLTRPHGCLTTFRCKLIDCISRSRFVCAFFRNSILTIYVRQTCVQNRPLHIKMVFVVYIGLYYVCIAQSEKKYS